MREFAKLFHDLDQSSKQMTGLNLLLIISASTATGDSIWVCWFLSGSRIKGAIKTGELRLFFERSGLPLWLIEESHDRVGDLAETISLLIEKRERGQSISLNKLIGTEYVEPMISLNLDGRREKIFKIWDLLTE